MSTPVNVRINQIIDDAILETKTSLDVDKIDAAASFGDYIFTRLNERVKEEFSAEKLNDPEFKRALYGLFDWR